MKRKKILISGIVVCLLAAAAIYQDRYPIPTLLAMAKIEMKLAGVVKISPDSYLVKNDYARESDKVKVVPIEGGDEWSHDLMIDGQRYPADWTIFLGRYQIYTLKTPNVHAPN